MSRQDLLAQIAMTMGGVPGWLDDLPDPQLELLWGHLRWFLSDTRFSARDKALAAFGAAVVSHCQY